MEPVKKLKISAHEPACVEISAPSSAGERVLEGACIGGFSAGDGGDSSSGGESDFSSSADSGMVRL